MAKKGVPAFASEAEEARWWAAHQDQIDDYLDLEPRAVPNLANDLKLASRQEAVAQAKKAGRDFATKAISLKMPISDLDLARQIAARKGLPYQTLLKSLIHEGLHRLDREAL